jgi:Flp pilus assembly protein TadD
MPKCLICNKDTEKKVCDECTNLSITPDGLAQIESDIINLSLREQLHLLDGELKADPENGILFYWKGVFQEFAGNVEEAIRSFDRGTRFQPDLDCAWVKKGNILFELGRYREAIRSLQTASDLRPDDWQMQKVLGYCLQEEGMYDKSIEIYSKILETRGNDVEILNAIGHCHGEEEDWDKAIEVYKKGLTIDEHNPQTLSGLAKSFNMMNKFEEAIEVYMSAISRGARDPDLWVGLGDAYLHIQEYNNAIEAYEKAISIQPNLRLRSQGKDLVNSIRETLHLGGFGTESEQLAGKEAQRLLNQAAKSFNEGNYKYALQSLKDVSKLSEDAKRFYDSTIEYIRNDVKVLDRHDINHEEIDKLLNDATDAFSKNSLTEAYTLAKIAQGKTNEMIQPLIKGEAEVTLGRATRLYSELKSKDIDVGEAEDLLLKAQDAFSNTEYLETRSFGNKANAILQGIDREYQRDLSAETLTKTEELIAQAQTNELEVEGLKKLLSEAKAAHESRDYPTSLEKCSSIKKDIDGLRQEQLINYIRDKIKDSKEILVQAQERGISIDQGNELIQKASHAFSEGDFETAKEWTEQLVGFTEIKDKELKKIRAEEEINKLTELITIGVEEGVNLEDSQMLLQEATEAFEIEKYDIALELALKDYEITQPMVNEVLESKAKKMFNEVAQLISECKDYEIDVAKQIEIMSKSQEHFANKDFMPSIQISQQVMTMLSEVRKEHLKRISGDLLEESEKRIQELEAKYPGIGLSEIKELVNDAKEHYNSEKYQEAWGWVKEAKGKFDEVVAAFLKEKSAANLEESKTHSQDIDTAFTISRESDKDLTSYYDRFNDQKSNIDKVQELLNAQNFEQGYAASVSVLSTVKSLREEVYKDFCYHLLTQIKELLKELKEMGLDITEATEKFKEIQRPFSGGEYQETITMAEDCKDWLHGIKLEFLKEKAKELNEKAIAAVVDAKDVGCEVGDLEVRITTGIEMEKAENLENAIMIFNEVNSEATNRLNAKLMENAQNAIKETQELMVGLQELGIDLAEPGQLMNEAVNAMNEKNFKGCVESANSAKEKALELENEHYRSQAEQALQTVQAKMEKLKERELDVARAQEVFENAQAQLDEGKFKEAHDSSEKVSHLCDIITYQALCSMAKEQYDTIKTEMEEAKGLGIDLPELQQRLEEQGGALEQISAKPEEELSLPDELQKPKLLRGELVKILKKVQEQKLAILNQKATELDGTTTEKIEHLIGMGIDTGPTQESYSQAQEVLAAQDPAQAIKLFETSLEICEGLLKEFLKNKVDEDRQTLIENLATAKADGVEVEPVEEKVRGIDELSEKEEFENAINEVGLASGMLEELVQEHWKDKAMEVLNKAKESLVELKNEGVDITRANEVFTSAKPAFQEKDYKTVLSTCEETIKVCDELKLEHRKRQALATIEAINKTKEEAKPMVDELVAEFSQEEEEMNKGFEEVLTKVNKLMEDQEFESVLALTEEAQEASKVLYDLLMKKRLGKTAQEGISRMEETIKPLEEEGIDIGSARGHLEESMQMMEAEEFEAVIAREEEFNKLLESARVFFLKTKAEEAQKELQENLKALTVLGVDITEFQNTYGGLTQTLQQGDYESVLTGFSDLNRQCLDARSKFYYDKSTATLNSFSEALATAKNDGMEVQEFEEYLAPISEEAQGLDQTNLEYTEPFYKRILEEVEPKLDDLKFAHTKFLKEKAKAVAEETFQKMDGERQELEDGGIDTGALLDHLKETRALIDAERFDDIPPREAEFQKMMEGARIFHQKQQAQQALETTKTNVRAVAELGIDITYFQEEFAKAKPMFEQAQYIEVSELMEKLDKESANAKAKHYTDILSGQFKAMEEDLASTTEAGMDASEFQGRFDELKKGFDSLDKEDVAGLVSYYESGSETIQALSGEIGQAKEEFLKKKAKENAEALISSMQEKLDSCDERWSLDKARGFIEETKNLLGEGKLDLIPPREDVFIKLIDVAEKKFSRDQLVERFKGIKGDLKSAKEMGVDISALTQQLVQAKDLLVSNDFEATRSALEQTEKELVVQKGTHILNLSAQNIQQFLQRAEQAKASGVDTSFLALEANNLLKEAEGLQPTDDALMSDFAVEVQSSIAALDQDLQTEIAAAQPPPEGAPPPPEALIDTGRVAALTEQRTGLEAEISQIQEQKAGLEKELKALARKRKKMEAEVAQ